MNAKNAIVRQKRMLIKNHNFQIKVSLNLIIISAITVPKSIAANIRPHDVDSSTSGRSTKGRGFSTISLALEV
jgi:hypothetical protein